ncbi:MAG: hypothetical protein EBU89_08390 [Actinobacteria bacterium]|nr:hypothetical protein [Actinomycetota bacterium]
MFANVKVTETTVFIEFSTWDKFLNASRKNIAIPREHIVSIDTGSEILKECKGFRAPGTYTFSQTYGFGVIAGTYRQRHGVKHFWNVRAKLADHTIRFNLLGSEFATVVLQVEDPKAISESLGMHSVSQ